MVNERYSNKNSFNAAKNSTLAIETMIGENIHYYRSEPAPVIQQRIRDLDNECDIEKTLTISTSGLAIAGILLSLIAGKKWLLLTVVSLHLGCTICN